MIVKILFGQRKGSYEGQFAPEVLSATTLSAYEEYPGNFDNIIDEYGVEIQEQEKHVGMINAITVVDVEIDGKIVEALLKPEVPNHIPGKIIERKEEE